MMTMDIIEGVVKEVCFPTGRFDIWEVGYNDIDLPSCSVRIELPIGHVRDVAEHLRCNYPKEWEQANNLTDALRDGYRQWQEDGSPDSEEDFDHRYDVAVSHLILEKQDGWFIFLRAGYGWWDVWQPLGELYVPVGMTEAELRKVIADTLGPALSFMHPRQIEEE